MELTKDTKKLGFGLMRLPLLDPADTTKIDLEAVCRMVDQYMQAGFRYFDTAAPYHGGGNSELAFRTCVAERYPREDYILTDKLSFFIVKKAEDLEGFFAEQLARCGVAYFDYYLLHSMKKSYFELAESIDAFSFIAGKKAEGKIRHIGLSFHDTPEVLDEILTKHPELEIVQLQINYIDWENEDVQARRCYEVAVKHNKPVIVMEPVKGGLLAGIPEDAEALFKEAAPNLSVASWAVRYAASLEHVVMVLSGMSNQAQMDNNLSYMTDFKPLTQKELQIVEKAATCILSKANIACTACRYCVDGCPKKIPIPNYFRLVNDVKKFGALQADRARKKYARMTQDGEHGKASACINCKQCERNCPQHLPITEYLKETAALLEADA